MASKLPSYLKKSMKKIGLKDGSKPGLWANINRRKRLGISRPKSQSTISPKAYANMKAGFPKRKKMMEGGVARGCGAIMPDRKKVTKRF
jgi:hypothetical protein